MLIDKSLQFLSGEAWAAGVTDSLALSEVGAFDSERRGEQMEIIVQVTEAFAGAGTMTLNLVTATTPGLAANKTTQRAIFTGAAAAALPLGKKFRIPLELPVSDPDATHIGFDRVQATGANTGAIAAWIQRAGEDQDWVAGKEGGDS